jgi:hypothetical protein
MDQPIVTSLEEALAKPGHHDPVQVRGFYRVQLTDPKDPEKIVGDSGWQENIIVDAGKRYFLVYTLGAIAGSGQVSQVAIGSGGLPNATDTTLGGEVVKRAAASAASNGSTSVQFTATFSSTNSFVTNTQNISNIGLFNSTSGGTLFAGNTYNSSSCATNQNVNVTYTVTFS